MDWRIELYKLLGVFEQQTSISLRNIKTAFNCSGFAFNDEFKQYFLRVSTDRIKNTYEVFELASMFEDEVSAGPEESFSMADKYEMNLIHEGIQDGNDEPDDTTDSDDEGDQPGYRMKLELLEELAAIQANDRSHELNDFYQYDDDNHVDEIVNSDSTDFQNEVSLIINDGHGDTNTPSKRLSTISNNIDGTGINKMVGRTVKCPRKRAEKRSMSSKQMVMNKRFKCELCSYSSNYRHDLNLHMRTHTGEKPYRCDICRKRFTQSVHMKRHKVTHTDVIPFHCRGCFTGFLKKEEKEAHDKVCKNRRYECHLCKKYVTSKKCDLKMHMLLHSGEKPFRCEICMKRFTAKCSLNMHLDTIHTRINS